MIEKLIVGLLWLFVLFMLVYALTVVVTAPAHAEVKVIIDKRAQTACVITPDKIYHWKVSTARKGYSTPVGVYHPTEMDWAHFSKLYEDSPMPFAIFFNSNIAIHGTPEYRHLGKAVSHGCIRLSVYHALLLWHMVKHHKKETTFHVMEHDPYNLCRGIEVTQ